MPWMLDDKISKSEIEDGIEITDVQYQELLEAKMAGKKVTVRDGQPFIYSGDKRTVYKLDDNQVVSQEIPKEDETPASWQDTEPTPEPEVIIKKQFSSLEYLDRFTQAEQEAIVGATYSNVQIKMYYDRLLAATFIDLDDPRTEVGIDALIAVGLLDAGRKAALMEPELIG